MGGAWWASYALNLLGAILVVVGAVGVLFGVEHEVAVRAMLVGLSCHLNGICTALLTGKS